MARAKYINPYTDFGFKKLFGEEASKDLLIDFLNELLPEKHKIVDLHFKNNENLDAIANQRKAIFDIYCKSGSGEQFIVEMQKAKIKFFKDRALFYTTFPIREQAEKGEWDFELKPVYCVAILDFEFNKKNQDYMSHVQLKNQYCEVFFDKLAYFFIEMPRFTKKEDELKNHFEKWLYFLKNLEDFDSIPAILKEPVFEKGFHIAEIANYTQQELDEYEESLKTYRDLKGVLDTSFEEGLKEGEQIGLEKGEQIGLEKGEQIGLEKGEQIGLAKGLKKKAIETAKKMLPKGYPVEDIMELTGLTAQEIEAIRKELED